MSDTAGLPPRGKDDRMPDALDRLSPIEIRRGIREESPTLKANERSKLFNLRSPTLPLSLQASVHTEFGHNYDPKKARIKAVARRRKRIFLKARILNAPLAESLSYRVALAWRCMRQSFRNAGRHKQKMTMVDLLCPREDNVDPWSVPDQPPYPSSIQNDWRLCKWAEAQAKARNVHQQYQPYFVDNSGTKPRIVNIYGVPHTPPPPPVSAYDDLGHIKSLYDPESPDMDPVFHCFLHGLHGLLEYMGAFKQGCNEYTRNAAEQMVDPLLCRIAWPSRFQIVEFEESVVEKGIHVYMQHGASKVLEMAVDEYGISPVEAVDIVAMVENKLTLAVDRDEELQKRLQIVRLESLADRSRTSGDGMRELGAIKELNKIHGLGLNDSDKQNESLAAAARRVIEMQKDGHLNVDYSQNHLMEAPEKPKGASSE